MTFHKYGTKPENGEIFVFGSNLRGAHGGGAARAAFEHFGAQMGVAVGMSGNSYAIPTKDRHIMTLPLNLIKDYVDQFVEFSRNNPELEFFVTAVGCGLAGLKHEQMAPMFSGCGNNCSFPEEWWEYINDTDAQRVD